MRARDLFELWVLSLLWGGAYLFTRAAVPDFGPAPLVALRLGISALVLAPLLVGRGGWRALSARAWPMTVNGVAFTGLPFLMMSWAALSLGAGFTAILTATAPLFAAIVAWLWLRESISRWRVLGLAIGFAGVALLGWGNAGFRDGGTGWALVALLVSALLWGIGGHWSRRRLDGASPVAISVGTLAVGALALAPLAAATWPERPPSARAWLEVGFLGVASSGLGFLLYYRLVRTIGAIRATSVTFLNPPVAMVSAVLYLGEPITLRMVTGAAIVLAGTGLALGLVGPKPAPVSASPAPSAPPR